MNIAILTLLWGTVVSASCLHGTTLMPRADDANVEVFHFNYTATGGPLNWYGLDPEANSACAMGKFQSPINIKTATADYVPPEFLLLNIPRAHNAEFENRGVGLEVLVTNGTLVAGNITYHLAQFHFHTPGEHWVNEEYFPMETHFVFSNEAKQIAVIGFFFELSESVISTHLFESVFAHVNKITIPGTSTEIPFLDFSELTDHLYKNPVYQYSGSLTTPPCSEDVAWYISAVPLPLRVHSYNTVKKVLRFNSRYTQNYPGRMNLLEIAAQELKP